ncbi:hypothetical protein HY493_04120 [Candidatus Woesearchaeota archaeon]|nr:hypothetical protein [Candidatus Woesearchaeota archaeon]
MNIHLSTLLQYYKRPDVQQALVDAAHDKEIAVSFGGEGYGKRPDAIQYPKDVLEFVKNGATSFHCSEELWLNPLQITTGAPRQELDALRKGWDLVLDIDCPELTYSRIAADLLVQALQYHGINAISVKFSGNHGFHIAVPFESFPETVHGKPTKDWFPEGPRKIAAYLGTMIKAQLTSRLLALNDIGQIMQRVDKPREKLLKNGAFDPFSVLSIDTVLIAPRHLYRMPYSFNEKSGLVSIPIDPERILSFDKTEAKAENVKPLLAFLDRTKAKPGEATKLLVSAFDFVAKETERKDEKDKHADRKEFEIPTQALSENLFPPCVKLAAQGMKDGKKRALFALTNFFVNVGWDHDKMLAWLKDWNAKNPEPLRDQIIEGHVRYHKQSKKRVLPPNCRQFWEELGLCKPDGLCNRIKNPVSYASRRAWLLNRDKEEKEDQDVN